MRHYFSIFFYVKKKQPLKCGKLPIFCRISINKKTCTFSTHLSVEKFRWNNIRRRVKGRDEVARRTNALLDKIYYSLHEDYRTLLRSQMEPSPQELRRMHQGRHNTSEGIVDFFNRHNQDFEKMVGITRQSSTLYKYRYVCNHLQNFIMSHMQTTDLPLRKVDREFIYDFHRYLSVEAGCNVNTARTYLTAFKHILMLAVTQGEIPINPFTGYQLHSESSQRCFLMKEELRSMANELPRNDMESIVLEAFLFSCFTGLAYADIKRITYDDVVKIGEQWHIVIRRKKTRTSVDVPLLQLPLRILQKRYSRNNNAPIFSLPTNCWCNKLIKSIASRAGITKRVTFHTARHTFATTVTLAYGVPIEIVSRMLGHTDIKTTQIYAKVLKTTINSEMTRVSDQIDMYFEDYV